MFLKDHFRWSCLGCANPSSWVVLFKRGDPTRRMGAGGIPTPLTFRERTFLPFEFVKTRGLPLNVVPLPEWLFVPCAECCLSWASVFDWVSV